MADTISIRLHILLIWQIQLASGYIFSHANLVQGVTSTQGQAIIQVQMG